MAYTEFIRQLEKERMRTAQFYLGDLHVHTHDSRDYATIAEDISPEALEQKLTESEKQWKKTKQPLPAEEYIDTIKNCEPKIQIVAITDHGVCDVACQLACASIPNCIIIPGIEIKATVNQLSKTDTIHLLCIFDPSKNSQTIWGHVSPSSHHAYKASPDDPFEIPDLPTYIREHIHANDGICIAAHVDEKDGVRKHFFDKSSRKYVDFQTQKKVLERSQDELKIIIEANKSAASEEELSGVKERLKKIEEQLTQLGKQIKDRQYALQEQFLQLVAECGFDALQVRVPEDGQHYKGEHTRDLGIFPIATILASDAHYLAGIGRKATWFKMGDLSFTGLRRALSFPVCRVRLGDYQKPKYPKILGMRFAPDVETKAFFRKEDSRYQMVAFSDNLNCIIGGRGSGKSAIIDAMKLIFKGITTDESGLAKQIKNENDEERIKKLPDWMQRLAATMAKSTIEIAFQSEGKDLPSECFIVSHPFDFRFGARARVFNPTGHETGATTGDRKFEVDVYGWHELEKLGQSCEAQRSLLDRFAYTGDFLEGIEQAINDLVSNRETITRLAKEIAEIAECEELQNYAQRKTEFDYYNKPEVAAVFAELDTIEEIKAAATDFKDAIAQLLLDINNLEISETVERLCTELLNALSPLSSQIPTSDTVVPEGQSKEQDEEDIDAGKANESADQPGSEQLKEFWAKRISENLGLNDQKKRERIQDLVTKLLDEIKTYEDLCDIEISSLSQSAREKLAAILKDSEGSGTSHKEQRRQARERFLESQQKLGELKKKNQNLSTLLETRSALRENLNESCNKRTFARKEIVERINGELNEKVNTNRLRIKIDLGEQEDREKFQEQLLSILNKTGKRLHYKEKKATILADILTPEEVKNSLLDTLDPSIFIHEGGTTESKISDIQARAIIEDGGAKTSIILNETENEVVNYFDPGKLDDILKFDEIVFDDVPDVKLQVQAGGGEEPASITNLSPGQRCSALLPIILLRGNCPVVIDQPEDNLDNRLICDVVVDVLQKLKDSRQIIVATHNPNIPVSGDAEQVIVTEALTREQGRICEQGPIDEAQIIRQIKEILEGGEEAFKLRARRYNYDIKRRGYGSHLEL